MIADRARGTLRYPPPSAADLADELAAFAAAVLALPGVSRRDPGAFLEAKSELAGRLLQRAAQLRSEMARAVASANPSAAHRLHQLAAEGLR